MSKFYTVVFFLFINFLNLDNQINGENLECSVATGSSDDHTYYTSINIKGCHYQNQSVISAIIESPEFQKDKLSNIKIEHSSVVDILANIVNSSTEEFGDLKNIELLNNGIRYYNETFLQSFTSIENLVIRDNTLGFTNSYFLPSVKTLKWTMNHINEYILGNFNTSIGSIKIENTSIVTDESNSKNMITVHANYNKLIELHLINCSLYGLGLKGSYDSLEHLDLAHNKIIDEKFQLSGNMKELITLNLSFNKIRLISSINFTSFPNLQRLIMNNNRIYFIPTKIFMNNKKLKVINLKLNKLHQILFVLFLPNDQIDVKIDIAKVDCGFLQDLDDNIKYIINFKDIMCTNYGPRKFYKYGYIIFAVILCVIICALIVALVIKYRENIKLKAIIKIPKRFKVTKKEKPPQVYIIDPNQRSSTHTIDVQFENIDDGIITDLQI